MLGNPKVPYMESDDVIKSAENSVVKIRKFLSFFPSRKALNIQKLFDKI